MIMVEKLTAEKKAAKTEANGKQTDKEKKPKSSRKCDQNMPRKAKKWGKTA